MSVRELFVLLFDFDSMMSQTHFSLDSNRIFSFAHY